MAVQDEYGRTYYANEELGESSWERPVNKRERTQSYQKKQAYQHKQMQMQAYQDALLAKQRDRAAQQEQRDHRDSHSRKKPDSKNQRSESKNQKPDSGKHVDLNRSVTGKISLEELLGASESGPGEKARIVIPKKKKPTYARYKEGTLKLRGGLLGKAKARYFMVQKNDMGFSELAWYPSELKTDDADIIGRVVLDKAQAVQQKKKGPGDEGLTLEITPKESKEIVTIEADDAEGFEEWLYVLEDQGAIVHRILKQGWLHKTSSKGKVWQERYFVCFVDQLLYYRKITDAKPAGDIPLVSGAETADLDTRECDREHAFYVAEDSAEDTRRYQLATRTDNDRAEWVALLNAIHASKAAKVHHDSIIEEYMFVRGAKKGEWNKRYCCLFSKCIRVFAKPSDVADEANVPLLGDGVVSTEYDPDRAHTFAFTPTGDEGEKTLLIAAKSGQEREKWVKAMKTLISKKETKMNPDSVKEGYMQSATVPGKPGWSKRYVVLTTNRVLLYRKRWDTSTLVAELHLQGGSRLKQGEISSSPGALTILSLCSSDEDDSEIPLLLASADDLEIKAWKAALDEQVKDGGRARDPDALLETPIFVRQPAGKGHPWVMRYGMMYPKEIKLYARKWDSDPVERLAVTATADWNPTAAQAGKQFVVTYCGTGDADEVRSTLAFKDNHVMMRFTAALLLAIKQLSKQATKVHFGSEFEGYLEVQSITGVLGGTKLWNRRFVVLANDALEWYVKRLDKDSEGEHAIPGGTVVDDSLEPFSFYVAENQDANAKKVVFKAKDAGEREKWKTKIRGLVDTKDASINAQSILEGYLQKKSKFMKDLLTHYFILLPTSLEFNKTKADRGSEVFKLTADTEAEMEADEDFCIYPSGKAGVKIELRAKNGPEIVKAVQGAVDNIKRRSGVKSAKTDKFAGLSEEEFNEKKKEIDITFDEMLSDPTALKGYRAFTEEQFVVENIRYYVVALALEKELEADPGFASTEAYLMKAMDIYNTFIKTDSEYELNLSSSMRNEVALTFESAEAPKLDGKEFTMVTKEVRKLMETNSFNRFKLSKHYDAYVAKRIIREASGARRHFVAAPPKSAPPARLKAQAPSGPPPADVLAKYSNLNSMDSSPRPGHNRTPSTSAQYMGRPGNMGSTGAPPVRKPPCKVEVPAQGAPEGAPSPAVRKPPPGLGPPPGAPPKRPPPAGAPPNRPPPPGPPPSGPPGNLLPPPSPSSPSLPSSLPPSAPSSVQPSPSGDADGDWGPPPPEPPPEPPSSSDEEEVIISTTPHNIRRAPPPRRNR